MKVHEAEVAVPAMLASMLSSADMLCGHRGSQILRNEHGITPD